MKKIGLIGGLSWQSTHEYYRIINETVTKKLGDHHSSNCIIYSFDFEPMLELIRKEDWNQFSVHMIEAAKCLEQAGADLIIICCNTAHIVSEEVEKEIDIPLINIIDVTGRSIHAKGFNRVGLLGSTWTMESDFYKNRLKQKYNIDVIVPENKDREYINNIAFEELDYGIIKENTRKRTLEIIDKLEKNGAEAVVLGCTELPMLVQQKHSDVILFDTTLLHAQIAVEMALSKI